MIIDISRTLRPDMAVWPGDTPFNIETGASLAEGDAVNVTRLSLSAHTGSHVDAPYHFTAGGQTMDAVPLTLYWGPAQVVTVNKEAGPLSVADFDHVTLGRAPRLLVHSTASDYNPTQFPEEFIYPSPELAEHLGELGIILFGSDAPSMDALDSKDLAGHHALYRNEIAILEGLDLSQVEDGVYELVALPLKIAGGDGSPVRAVLKRET